MSHQLPKEFIEKMSDLLQDEAELFFQTYEKPRTAGLRLNTLKISNDDWRQISPFPVIHIPFVDHGYYYSFDREEPGKHPYHAAGLYYIQEPSAMFVATLLDAKPHEKILDLCAAPGGKSTQIGAAMRNTGLLLSNEIFPKRAKVLSENIERFGLKNTIVTNETPERLAKHFPAYFDKVLVDAPCSGEGMFRKDTKGVEYWSKEHVLSCRSNQLSILEHAYEMLKKDGILVYSTCTFSPEENEQVIETFIHKHPDIEILSIEKTNGVSHGRPEWTTTASSELNKTARLWPHKLNGEGHFAAKLKKRSEASSKRIKEMKTIKKREALQDFYNFQEHFLQNIDFEHLTLFGTNLYALPEYHPDLAELKVVRAGLHIGERKKNRFEPNHALALAINRKQVKQTFELKSDGNTWARYLKGETLKSENHWKGWVLITIDGYPLGWGKEAEGMIKNYYPKGLRRF